MTKNANTITARQDHVNTFKGAEMLRVGFVGDTAKMTTTYNNIRGTFGLEPVTEATIRRYCDGGRMYEQGPPQWFVDITDALWVVLMR